MGNHWTMQHIQIMLALFMMDATLTSSASISERRLEAMYHHLADSISRIEEKIAVDLTVEIDTLKDNMAQETEKREKLEEQLKSILDTTVSYDADNAKHTEDHLGPEHISCTCGPLETKMRALLKGFSSEKNVTRSHSSDVAEIADLMSTLSVKNSNTETRINNIDSYVQSVEQRSMNNSNSVFELQSKMSVLDFAQQTLVSRINNLSDTVTATESGDNTLLGEPFFVSPWTPIASQDRILSDITVEHGLGTIPLKVDVQVKPTTRPNAGWIFPGDSAIQSDDDVSLAYGGVVYFYNETHVRLLAPRLANNGDKGRVINTGHDSSFWVGNDHQKATSALVRVKVWGDENMSPPDFQTRWLPLDIRRRELSFYEINHGLGGYPVMVFVQIRVSNSKKTLLSDGMGSLMSSPYRPWSAAGGVIHAFSDKAIRIWSPFWVNDTAGATTFGTLLGTLDGWGNHGLGKHDIGGFRVSAWSYTSLNTYGSLFSATLNHGASHIYINGGHFASFDMEKDLMTCYAQAATGVNKGFRFRGWGSSQTTTTPFGGVIYSYDEMGTVKIWKPNESTGGYLIHVAAPNGDGQMMQFSNDAIIFATVIRADKRV